ncbi:DUF1765-domain-containing protein [Teratosphaeria nubilosa]|uniref:DUF1765-domain-containing protein n=1 Tax=Teratosphaeria nubilosa TaxID=161662 RepID=A0A6G1L2G5_9PEZI|nr:DUF1765-domain-containing protein [Teratosphaeria nubilosa]
MAAVATERIKGYGIRPRKEVLVERGRAETRVPSPKPQDKDAAPFPARNADFPRSASYTYLPEAKETGAYVNPSSIVTIKGSFTDADLTTDDPVDISPPDSSGWTTPEEAPLPPQEHKVPEEESRRLIAELQKGPKGAPAQDTREAISAQDDRSSVDSSVRRGSGTSTIDSVRTNSTQATTPGSVPPRPRISTTNSFSRRVRRKSWYGASEPSTPSRSPSPPKKQQTPKPDDKTEDGAHAARPVGASPQRRKSFLRRRDSKNKDAKKPVSEDKGVSSADDQAPGQKLSRRSTLLRRKTRPASQVIKASKEDESPAVDKVPAMPIVPKVPPLPKSFSTDRLPSIRSQTPQPHDRAAPIPRLLSAERIPNGGLSIPIKKKDELWGVFRSLDGDYAKFASKSVAFKANVVRSSLLPFLREYAPHPSNKTLRAEDLDRRANILNKWWTGLIEMLHGRNNQSISGTDRPAILDGISGIMDRPEWRLAPSPFCAMNERLKSTRLARDRSATSLSSSASEFLTESVHHNVRNIFIQNLSAQMAFVVDKMSLRNASASLVTFCGKACAYAFVFVPGMADVLVRLWEPHVDTLRRVLNENGIGKFDQLADISDHVTANFPPALHNLGFVSLMKYMRKLRIPPPLPLGTANIQWWGHWLERWTGRESDLFYVFVKHFHILVTDFLQPDSTRHERMCAPGLLLVHAQILVNLDATIHRDANGNAQDPTAVHPSPTFDDVLADPDAVASAMPIPPTNAVRIMAENRLIMLIRDFLSERTADHPIARHLFAESFNSLLQCAARGTSMFDHAACYTLLDFFEEALVIMVRFEHVDIGGSRLINFDFWLNVCKRMIGSHNTMTEVRLYAFLYTAWNTIVADLGRKSDLCLGLLLDKGIFESRFNHWCPMVRAYYMRLLCWRVGRFDGDLQKGDIEIYETMQQRLQSVWSHYLYQRQQAEANKSLLPPTNPCSPAPGRRLIIVRTDGAIAPGHSFLSFDGLAPRDTPLAHAPVPNKRFSTVSHVVEMDSRAEIASRSSSESEMGSPQEKGFSGFLRKMMGGSKRSKSKGPSADRKTNSEDEAPVADNASIRSAPALTRSATDEAVTRPRTASQQAIKPARHAHHNFSFKFSLEYLPSKNAGHGPMRLMPPKLPLPAQTALQTQSAGKLLSQVLASPPKGESREHARYAGRALAEWTIVVGECQSFFDRRKHEGVPEIKFVETPTMGVEVFKRPG